MSLDDVLQEVFGEGVELTDISIDLLQILDDLTMQCETCGWWCEPHEFVDDNSDDSGSCTDCREGD